jgi:hypothetical protein
VLDHPNNDSSRGAGHSTSETDQECYRHERTGAKKPVVEPAAVVVEGLSKISQLETLAAVIKDGIAAGELLMFKTQERYRRVGVPLTANRRLVSHEEFERCLEDHCLLCIETPNIMCVEMANNEMRIYA